MADKLNIIILSTRKPILFSPHFRCDNFSPNAEAYVKTTYPSDIHLKTSFQEKTGETNIRISSQYPISQKVVAHFTNQGAIKK